MNPPSEAGPQEVLLFTLERQRYGLPVEDVRELVRAARLTPLPQAPDVVEGLLNLRGELLPVLDLRRRFRHPARALSPMDHFIVASTGGRLVAMRVDRAEGLHAVTPGEWDPSPRELPGVGYVAGAAKLTDGLVLVHDLRSFLSEAEALQLDSALGALPEPA
ncbi:purine-binding chemotaxis protein CheW [Corallococcus exiguus]|uniref:Chemotaxis protein CheW n=1 Tax=Corallococcus exiguus TaxID=83462 RepID=A0A7X5BVT4_9BACT|nr:MULTISPECIES: chemotaxis protein CheW [Corallococcus]NBC42632.1 chemotaxis protein CheW [Corallococcus exiguus]NNC17166.1 purine-binding chemotaxis protein CheW [Corallococcus exiguus]NRD57665.1 purine-binding chemotaxis protein CheW [Corallococcus exiguus]RKI07182.1 purine-binding chemotaxis protein CheW [Corallococcus sp. AB030]RUO89691.1 purine-binding chemotaxis protein CheW [Corallococcus sp. AB018]